MRPTQTRGMNVSYSVVSLDSENIVVRVGYRSDGKELTFNVSLKREPEANVLHLFECS